MINDSIIQSKRPGVVTKKYFLSWIVVAELLCFMKRLRDKVNNDDVSAKYWRQGSEWPRRPPTLSGASDTYSWTIFIYVVPVSLLVFLGILLHVNNGNTKKKNCEIYWQLTVKVQERPQWLRICAFIINFEHISHIVMVFPLLAGTEPVNIDWVKP